MQQQQEQHVAQDAAAGPQQPAGGNRRYGASPLDRTLAAQPYALELLLPTPTNINPIHVPGPELLAFIRVQQWVADKLRVKLPLLHGIFVLVPSQQLPAQGASSSIDTAAAADSAAIPWRLRQVSAVEAPSGADPAAATVLLVGGGQVAAGAVSQDLLTDVPEHEYLCCELAQLQANGELQAVRVFDEAHVAWRLRVAIQIEEAIQAYEQVHFSMPAASANASKLQEAARRAQQAVVAAMKQMAPNDWLQGEILKWIDLNPTKWPDPPDAPWTLLSAGQYNQLLQDAAAAWQQYVQHKLAGQQPQPLGDGVPWVPLHCSDQQQQPLPQQQQQPPQQQQPQPPPQQQQQQQPVASAAAAAPAGTTQGSMPTQPPAARTAAADAPGAIAATAAPSGVVVKAEPQDPAAALGLQVPPPPPPPASDVQDAEQAMPSPLPPPPPPPAPSVQHDRQGQQTLGPQGQGQQQQGLGWQQPLQQQRPGGQQQAQGQQQQGPVRQQQQHGLGQQQQPQVPAKAQLSHDNQLNRQSSCPSKGLEEGELDGSSLKRGRGGLSRTTTRSSSSSTSSSSRSRSRSSGSSSRSSSRSRSRSRSRGRRTSRGRNRSWSPVASMQRRGSSQARGRQQRGERTRHKQRKPRGRGAAGQGLAQGPLKRRWPSEAEPWEQQPASAGGRGGASSGGHRGGRGAHADRAVPHVQGERDMALDLANEWMRNLALLLRPGSPHSPPQHIRLNELSYMLPIPRQVVGMYGGVMKFIKRWPGLMWIDDEPEEGPKRGGGGQHVQVGLNPDVHAELLAAAAAADRGRRGGGGKRREFSRGDRRR